MKKKKNQSSKLLHFITAINGFVQLGLFIGTLVYVLSIYTSELPLLEGMIAVVIWLLAVAPISIVIDAIATQQDSLRNQSQVKTEFIPPPLPPLKVFMIRSSLAWIIYVMGFVAIISIAFLGKEMMFWMFESLPKILAIVISSLACTTISLGILSALCFVVVPQPLLDFYLYPNKTIQIIVYKNGANPIGWQQFKFIGSSLIQLSLLLGVNTSVILSVKLLPTIFISWGMTENWAKFISLPVYGLMLYGSLRFAMWFVRR